MNVNDNIVKAAEFAGCVDALKEYDTLIEKIKSEKVKNVAIIGDRSCGKTTLLNMLVGEEIKTPSVLPTSERPVMVTANAGAVKAGYEFVFTSSEKLKKANVNFYEMPYASMLDKKTNELKREFMEMDLAICVISATMPCTASDIAAIRAAAGGLVPTVIYVSKLDNLDDGDAAAEVKEYVESVMNKNFDATVVGIIFGDKSDKSVEIYKFIDEINLDELHEFRCVKVEHDAAECVKRALETMLENVNNEKKERAEKNADIDSENSDKKLLWDNLRMEMLDRCQKCIDSVGAKVMKSKAEVKNSVTGELNGALDKKGWVDNNLSKKVSDEMCALTDSVNTYVNQLMNVDIDWLVSEIDSRFDRRIDIERLKITLKEGKVGKVEFDAGKSGIVDLGIALGAAAIGVGALISSMRAVPTAAFTISAGLTTAYFLQAGLDKREAYNKLICEKAKEYCDSSYSEYMKNVKAQIKLAYEKLVLEVMKCARNSSTSELIFTDLYEKETEIKEKINSLE